jgi:hypothetical protein
VFTQSIAITILLFLSIIYLLFYYYSFFLPLLIHCYVATTMSYRPAVLNLFEFAILYNVIQWRTYGGFGFKLPPGPKKKKKKIVLLLMTCNIFVV